MFKVQESDQFLEVEFYSPHNHNALSLAAARDLVAISRQYRKWDRPVVVSSAHPRMFCAGGDMAYYASLENRSAGFKVNREIQSSLAQFQKWQVVKVAIINGDVLGGGMEWLARFDFRWICSGVLLGFWQKRIGLTTGWGGGSEWARIIGEERVRQLLLEGVLMDPIRAQRLGLVDRVVARWSWRKEMVEWCGRIHSGADVDIATWSVKKESKIFGKLWGAPLHSRALRKFSKKN